MEEARIMPAQLCLNGDFDEQVGTIMSKVRLTRTEVNNINLLFKHLERAFQGPWPGCKVAPFGSVVTGLGIKTSDVDCFVDTLGYDGDQQVNVIIARNMLRRQPHLFVKLFAITSAKVPILKLYHLPTQKPCDISFKSPAGVRNSYLIGYLLHLDNRASTLAVIIKYWSKVHNLTGTNLVPNYALTLLVIFYLQMLNILPTVSVLQRHNKSFIIDHWDTAFNNAFNFRSNNSVGLYELLGGFFKFYSTLNYQDVIISPFTGNLVPKECFKTVDSTPYDFNLYKHNVGNQICEPIKLDTIMCVQDPFEHNRNCTMAVHKRLADNLLSHFSLAAKLYDDDKKDSFIKDILMMKPSVAGSPGKKDVNNRGRQYKKKNSRNSNKQQHGDQNTQNIKLPPVVNGRVTKANNRRNEAQRSLVDLYTQLNRKLNKR